MRPLSSGKKSREGSSLLYRSRDKPNSNTNLLLINSPPSRKLKGMDLKSIGMIQAYFPNKQTQGFIDPKAIKKKKKKGGEYFVDSLEKHLSSWKKHIEIKLNDSL